MPLGALVPRAIRPAKHRSRIETRCEGSPHRLLYRRRAIRIMFVAARHPRPMSLSLDCAAHEIHARPPPSPGALTRAVASPSQVSGAFCCESSSFACNQAPVGQAEPQPERALPHGGRGLVRGRHARLARVRRRRARLAHRQARRDAAGHGRACVARLVAAAGRRCRPVWCCRALQ